MKRVTTSKCHILSTAIATMIAHGDLTTTIRKNMSSFDYIAGGVYVESIKHWCCLFISVKTSEVIFLDPMLASLEKQFSVLVNWKNFCKNRIGLKEITWKTRYLDHITQQPQDNFGVYVCNFFDLLINQKFCELKKAFVIDNYRRIIF